MKTATTSYREGSWFAIPLRTGGFGVGIVARARPRVPVVLAYLFGPRREQLPSLADVSDLTASSAVKVGRIGDLYLIENRWPIIGQSQSFTREAWPFPKFQRSNELSPKARLIEYEDDDPGAERAETIFPKSEVSHLERDGVMGAGFVEATLTKILG